jgi:hypothetical protein
MERFRKPKLQEPGTEAKWRKLFSRFLVNNLLLIFSVMIALSGLVLQVGYHMGGPDAHHRNDLQTATMSYEQVRQIDQNKTIWGYNYSGWSSIHKITIVVFSLFMLYHISVHWKWYAGVVRKRLFGRNKEAISLTVLFLLVALTGIIPWLIDLSGSSSLLRMAFIEIHDKITFLLIVLLFLHMIRRSRWFVNTYRKLMHIRKISA